jgi:predicted nucleotidyltransferase
MGKFSDLKSKIKQKFSKKISREQLVSIAQMIKNEHPEWAELNDDILIMLLRITLMQFPTDQFDNVPEEELKQQIRNAFVNATKIHPDLQKIADPIEIQKLNDAYMRGRKLGVSGKALLSKVFKQLKKTIIAEQPSETPPPNT